MPAPAPINPLLLHTIFTYDASFGSVVPKPTAKNAARRTARTQWEIGAYRYSLHRLIWAMHNPDKPNPFSVQFRDGDRNNTRIENLYAIDTNPRWLGHVKQQRVRLNADGEVGNTPQHTTPAEPVKPRLSVLRRQEQEAEQAAKLKAMTDTFEEDVVRESQHKTINDIVAHWDDE
jgi:hypothetical protein